MGRTLKVPIIDKSYIAAYVSCFYARFTIRIFLVNSHCATSENRATKKRFRIEFINEFIQLNARKDISTYRKLIKEKI